MSPSRSRSAHPALAGALAVLALLATSRAHAQTLADGGDIGSSAFARAIAAERARTPAPALPRSLFAADDPLPAVELAPDGSRVAYLAARGEACSLWLLPAAGGRARLLLPRTQAKTVRWSRDGAWLFLDDGRTVSSYAVADGRGVRITLGGQAQRQVLMVDPTRPAALVVREAVPGHRGQRWRVVRIDAHGRRSILLEAPHWVHDVALDPATGQVRFVMRADGDADYVIDRVEDDGRRRMLMRWADFESGSLLSVTRAGALYLRGDYGGDLKRLLRLDPDGSLHTVHADPRGESDLEDVSLDPATGEPRVATYRTTAAASYGLGEAARHVAAIRARLPGRALDITVASRARAHWLVRSQDSAPQPRWYLYDPANATLRRILGDSGARGTPRDAVWAREVAVRWTASDGMRLHGFLWLPPGADPARVPLVVQVHGGPFSHNEAGYGRYDRMAQFLANRGYAVFQPDYRGSTGHGRAYGASAHGDFGHGRVHRDIVEGARALLAHGVGDPERVGITGHSFGGYSALLGATFEPGLFRVAVAGSPPADFGWLARWNVEHGVLGAGPGIGLEQRLRHAGVDVRDAATMARLHAQSPQANAAKLRVPLVLLAGGHDERVPIRAVLHYAATLRTLGREPALLVEPEGAHSPHDPLPREGYLFVVDAMLAAHLGGRPPAPPSAALRDYLDRNLRLRGNEFAAPLRRSGR